MRVITTTQQTTPGISWRAMATVLFALCATLASFMTGCAVTPLAGEHVIGSSFVLTNVFREQARLPVEMKRLAILPLHADGSVAAESGGAALEPILHRQLQAARSFDLVKISQAELKQWTGKTAWRSDESLPLTFFDRLKSRTGADAVLFVELTEFHPHPPVRIGWKLKLVDTEQARTWWSVDELFDSGAQLVSNGARRYYQTHFAPSELVPDSRSIFLSPRRYGQYTLDAVFASLPER